MKIVRAISIVALVILAISISTIMLVYNSKKEVKPYSAKLVMEQVEWRGGFGEKEE